MGLPVRTVVDVLKGEAPVFMARVDDAAAVLLTQAAISAIAYTIYELVDYYPPQRTALAGHSAVSVDKTLAVFDTLQTDARWTRDTTGYNFRHQPSMAAVNAFQNVGYNRYLAIYTITPTSGQPITVEFQVNVH